MKYFIAVLIFLSLTINAQAAIHTENVEYKHGDDVMEGYLAYDDAVTGTRPGVLIVHQWMGLTPYEKKRAEQLAELGYIAFAIDMYGKGIRPANREEAAAQAGKIGGDYLLQRSRAQAGLDVLKKHELTDTSRVAAIGYCFGGKTVLELARSGADIAGVVSFHGTLNTSAPAQPGAIKAKVLVLHGHDDPHVTPDGVLAFQKEMTDAGADWYMTIYGGAVHSFTQKEAGDDPSTGSAYNKKADKRSWKAMKSFFKEIFRGKRAKAKEKSSGREK